MTLDILNVVQLGSKRVVDVNHEDLPVGLALIEESHDTENLDLLDLADVADLFTDLANIERIVVTLGLGLGVSLSRVFPSLQKRCIYACQLLSFQVMKRIKIDFDDELG